MLLFGVISSPNTLCSSSAKSDSDDDVDESSLQLSVSASDDEHPACTVKKPIDTPLRKCIRNLETSFYG